MVHVNKNINGLQTSATTILGLNKYAFALLKVLKEQL